MVLVESTNIPLGTTIPDFKLFDPLGNSFTSDSLFGDKGLLLAITCNHCPYAIAVWPRLIQIAEHAKTLNINTVAINPNINPNYPEDSPDKMIEKVKEWEIPFPYLVDDTQEVARELLAQCTPDIYLFDKNQTLVYHGRIDDNWQDEAKVTREELKEAINDLCTENPIDDDQKPTIGCSIKWL